MRRKTGIIVSVVFLIGVFTAFFGLASAASTVKSGKCGDNVYYTIDSDGNAVLSGTGKTYDYSNQTNSLYSPFYRTDIVSVRVEEGVTSVGWYLFDQCTSLQKVYLANSVKEIGIYAFQTCALRNVDFIDHDMKIGYYAFKYNYGLSDITINGALKETGSLVFNSCPYIRSVTLCEGVETISYAAFKESYKLEKIVIPKSVTRIASEAFLNDLDLQNVILPPKLTAVENSTFFGCYGFTGIKLPCAVETIQRLGFAYCKNMKYIYIPKSVKKIEAEAFVGCEKLTTVYYEGSEEDKAKIDIADSKNNYLLNAVWKYNGETDFEEKPVKITMERSGVTTDLTTERAVFTNGSYDTAVIKVEVDWGIDNSGRILLSQGGGVIAESTTGVFTLMPGRTFSSGSKIYAIWMDSEGKTKGSALLNLYITSNQDNTSGSAALSAGTINLLEAFGFDVPDGVPLIEKQSFNIGLGSMKTDIDIDGSTFKIAVGADLTEYKTENKHFKKQDWEGLKKGFKSAKEGIANGLETYENLSKYVPAGTILALKNNASSTGTFVGYIEGYIDTDGNMKISEGGFVGSADIKYQYQGMTLMGVVPLYYDIGVGCEASLTLGVRGYVPDKGIKGAFVGDFTVEPYFEMGCGVGIPCIFTFGGKGKASLEVKLSVDHDHKKVSANGSLKIQVKGPFNIMAFQKEVAKGSYLIYETGNPNTMLGEKSSLFSMDEIYSVDLNDKIKAENRSDTTAVWKGEQTAALLLDGGNNVRVLEENAYSGSSPIVNTFDGKRVIAYLTDNKARDDFNKSTLCYTVYDSESGEWSAPVAVLDNGCPDYSPILKDGYIVWQKTSTPLTENDTFSDMCSKSEIYASKWNGEGFDAPVRLTDNSLFDHTPKIAAYNGETTIVWLRNSNNDMYGTSGTNEIEAVTIRDDIFSEPFSYKSLNYAVTDLDVTYDNSFYSDHPLDVSYCFDTDNDLSTITDRRVYQKWNGHGEANVTSSGYYDLKTLYCNGYMFRFSDGIASNYAFMAGGEIFTEPKVGLTDSYKVCCDKYGRMIIYWLSVKNGKNVLYGAINDGFGWSEDVVLAELDESINNPCVFFDDTGISVAFVRAEVVPDDGYFMDGKTDLCIMPIGLYPDVALSNAHFTDGGVSLDVSNKGLSAASGVSLAISDGFSQSSITVDKYIAAGQSITVVVPYTKLAESDSAVNVTINANTADYREDVSDNTVTLSYGQADLYVTDTAWTYVKNSEKITARVWNIGFEKAENVAVNLRFGNVDGEIIVTQIIDVEGNSYTDVSFDVDSSRWDFCNNDEMPAFVEAVSDTSTSDLVLIADMNRLSPYDINIVEYQDNGETFNILALVNSNTDETKNATMIVAFYSQNGGFLGIDCESVALQARQTNAANFEFPTPEDVGKVFAVRAYLFDSLESVKPLTDFAYKWVRPITE